MSTNPNNAIGTNGAFGGRTSVNAFNDGIAGFSSGILSGWECVPDTGLTVAIGGDGNSRDVAIAIDNAGNKTTIDNISGSPISVTVNAAPNTNSRIDSIVAYVDNPPTGSATATDNYGACGIIVVSGTVASTPVEPNESTIRTAITADGASGTTAYYVVLANITIASGTTDLTSDNISKGESATIDNNNLDFTNTTTTQTITWKNEGGTTVGSTTCTMVKLDDSGLTLCTMSGVAWANNSSAVGYVNIKSGWQTAPKSIVGGVVDCSMSSDTGSYKTYGAITTSGFDIWLNKTTSGTRNLNVQAIFLAYF